MKMKPRNIILIILSNNKSPGKYGYQLFDKTATKCGYQLFDK